MNVCFFSQYKHYTYIYVNEYMDNILHYVMLSYVTLPHFTLRYVGLNLPGLDWTRLVKSRLD